MPQENVHIVGDRVLGLDCFPTPGHASHHVSYLDPDGTLYAGDAAGVRILPGRFVMPPTPPPESTSTRGRRRSTRSSAALPSGSPSSTSASPTTSQRHLAELRLDLLRLGRVGRRRRDARRSSSSTRAPSSRTRASDVADVRQAMPFWQSYRGLKRWAEKRGPLVSRA